MERELDRLLKRKTLIQASSLQSLEARVVEYNRLVDYLMSALRDFYSAVASI